MNNVYIATQRGNELRGPFDSPLPAYSNVTIRQYETFSAILSGRLVVQIEPDGNARIVKREEAI